MRTLVLVFLGLLIFALPVRSEPPSQVCLEIFSDHARQQGFLDMRKFPNAGMYVDMLPREDATRIYGEFVGSQKAWYQHVYRVLDQNDIAVLRAATRLDSKADSGQGEGKVYFQAVLSVPECTDDAGNKIAFIAYDWLLEDGKIYVYVPPHIATESSDTLVWDPGDGKVYTHLPPSS